ncbi:MAG: phosphodiester glycosidase family protein [Halothece sp. Uz-M2-17]|nr:phosphodiester glycosidase family protein [Halothece sp. Uz-M2-17]
MKWHRQFSKIGLGLVTVLVCILMTTVSNAQSNSSGVNVLRQGEEIIFNGDQLPISWRQWEANGETHLGISDTAAQQRLGLELLSSNNPQVQPVWWFGGDNRSAYRLSAQHLQANRYLDLTPILRETTEQLSVVGNQLDITTTLAQVQNIRIGKQSWGERIVVDLDRPLLWNTKEGREKATLTLPALTPTSISQKFSPETTAETKVTGKSTNSSRLVVKADRQQTQLEINLPEDLNLRVSTLANPARLVIDLRSDDVQSKQIRWAQGVDWRQDYISTADGTFAVKWLQLEPRLGNLNLTPIWSNPEQMQGIARLANTGKENQVPIAINGGFFNRDTKLPLGAIKREGQWYSSPILNRGAIAWDNQGQMIMDRLRYEETLRTSNGQTFSLQALNSGYVQSGIARYTPTWGVTYTPLTAGETVVVVENERVQQLVTGNRNQPIPIPSNGYVLTIRKKSELASAFRVGTSLQLSGQSFPSDFDRYPNILAAGPLLIKNGRVVLDAAGENFSRAFINQKAHRSAIALTRQGKILLVAMGDGLGRKGPTLTESTAILKRLGAIEALNLDGGSSTSLYLGGELINRSPATSARIHNGIGVYRSDQ